MTLRGYDISTWQAATPPLAGIAFVVVRATYGTFSDGRYAMHAANVRKSKVPLGAYAFGRNEDGAAQARALIAAAPTADFYALDLEADVGHPQMTGAQARAFFAAMHATGRKAGLYHSLSGFPSLGQDWNWVAAWGIEPNIPWTIHQIGGSGIDTNLFQGDAAALAKFVAAQRSVPVTLAITPPRALTPSAEPVAYAGLITSLILAAIQALSGQGVLTSTQANGLTSQAAVIANTIITILPFLISLVTRQTVTPNASLPAPVTTTTSTGGAVTLNQPTGIQVRSSDPLPAGTKGSVTSGTRRWSLGGTELPPFTGPGVLDFVAVDVLAGAINGSFLRSATTPPVYVSEWHATLLPAATTNAVASVVVGTPTTATGDVAAPADIPPVAPVSAAKTAFVRDFGDTPARIWDATLGKIIAAGLYRQNTNGSWSAKDVATWRSLALQFGGAAGTAAYDVSTGTPSNAQALFGKNAAVPPAMQANVDKFYTGIVGSNVAGTLTYQAYRDGQFLGQAAGDQTFDPVGWAEKAYGLNGNGWYD